MRPGHHMKTPFLNQAPKWAALICVWLLPNQHAAAQWVEISADIEITSYRGGDAKAAANAIPRTISEVCTVGANEWRIENNHVRGGEEKWCFDGTNVYNSVRITQPLPAETRGNIATTAGPALVPFETANRNLTIRIWESRDGNPLGDAGVNLPWLAFCSGPALQREGRLIPLPCEILRHCYDRYAYSDKTVTFTDGFGLPESNRPLFIQVALSSLRR